MNTTPEMETASTNTDNWYVEECVTYDEGSMERVMLGIAVKSVAIYGPFSRDTADKNARFWNSRTEEFRTFAVLSESDAFDDEVVLIIGEAQSE